MVKEFNLSEKLVDCHCGCGEKKCMAHKNNLKLFIKLLKKRFEKLSIDSTYSGFSEEQSDKIINQLAGERLS